MACQGLVHFGRDWCSLVETLSRMARQGLTTPLARGVHAWSSALCCHASVHKSGICETNAVGSRQRGQHGLWQRRAHLSTNHPYRSLDRLSYRASPHNGSCVHVGSEKVLLGPLLSLVDMHLPYAVAAHEFVLRNGAVAIPVDGVAQKRGKLLQPAFINHRPPVDLVHGRK